MSYTTLNDVLSTLDKVTPGDGYHMACCPCHADRTPSLQVSEGTHIPVTAHCHGCGAGIDEVLTAVGIDPKTNRFPRNPTSVRGWAAFPAGTAVTPTAPRTQPQGGRKERPTVPTDWLDKTKKAPLGPQSPVNKTLSHFALSGDLAFPTHEYAYYDHDGAHVYSVVRYFPKNFRQFHRDNVGNWVIGVKGIPRMLYRLDLVKSASNYGNYILFVDGEKDVDTLTANGIAATCVMGGGKGTYPDTIKQDMANVKLIVVVDKDEAGLTSAKRIADEVKDTAQSVQFVVLPDHPEYAIKDISDFYNAGYNNDDLTPVVNGAIGYEEFVRTYYPDLVPAIDLVPPNVQSPQEAPTDALPVVALPQGGIPYSVTASALGDLMAKSGRYFNRGGTLVRVDTSMGLTFKEVTATNLQSGFEEVATLVKVTNEGPVPANCSKLTASAILHAEGFMAPMPEVKGVSKVPVLVVNEQGSLTATTGYCPVSKMYSQGRVPELMPVGDAVAIINEALADFKFSSQGDRARAIAAILTPAAIRGSLLGGRAPFDLGEADGSQAGKTYRHKLIAAMYNEKVDIITQGSSRGVGNVEEALSAKLLAGSGFISIDNMRGKLDSPMIEAMATGDTVLCRVAYSSPQTVDPSRVTLQATSNRAEITRDLANRSSVVRIRHRGFDYQWKTYPEGDILDHIRGNQHKYYSAIYTILNEWVRAGRPVEPVTDHSFKAWAGGMGWIVRHLFNAGDLLAGHKEIQARMTVERIGWLRDVAIHILEGVEPVEAPLTRSTGIRSTSDILEVCLDHELEVPGMGKYDNPEDPEARKRILQSLGRRLGRIIPKGETYIDVDGYRVYRGETTDELYRKRSVYTFMELNDEEQQQ